MKNGKLLADILDRHALIVLNGLQEKQTGIIIDGVEKSVIDFVITRGDLVKHIEHVHIDDKRQNVRTKLYNPKFKKKLKIVESDHK